MSDTTARHLLVRPAAADVWNRQAFLNDNWNLLDSAIDRVFTSTARPTTNIKIGMRGYETDTGNHMTCTQDSPSVVWTEDKVANGLETRVADLESRVAALEADTRYGWTYIGSGAPGSDFTMDLTGGGKYPAGTFDMIRITMSPSVDTGNTWIVGTVNGIGTADYYNRGWYGESFDGTTAVRNVSNSSTRAVFGYCSAQIGSSLEIIIQKTKVASELPMMSFSTRDAPFGFDANREWMKCTNTVNTNTLIENINFFATTGVIAVAPWYAEGFLVP